MEKSMEDSLIQAIRIEDIKTVSMLLSKGTDFHRSHTLFRSIPGTTIFHNSNTSSKLLLGLFSGANPNKIVSHGKTCLGEAANMGNVDILQLLISASNACSATYKTISNGSSRKRVIKCHKRKLRHDEVSDESNVKCKNLNDRITKTESLGKNSKLDRNQGYFVFIHSEGTSSEDSRIASLRSPLTPSPQADLEWDEEIGNVAPTTSEDETWTSMYKWYAAILESTGAAIAAASYVTNGIDQQDAFARAALHYAAEQGHARVVKLLLEAGCKVDVTAADGLTPLHIAVIRNDVEIVRLLLTAGSNVNYKTHDKMTPLHFAATRGLLDLVKNLVNNGAYLEARDSNERTALYLAAGRGHVDIVKHLISCGANVNGEEIHGYTPLCEAVWQKYASVVDVLLYSGARITHSHRLLHNAIIHRQEEIVKLLTNYGGGINLHNDNGDTPLLLATRLSQPNVVKILLQKGANANCSNSITGANALHIAVESVDDRDIFEELLKGLLEHKIDINGIALTGDTALNRALLLHKDDAAVLLIRYGADVNACDQHSCGLDNLSIASRRKNNTLASMLLKAGHYTTIIEPKATDKTDCAVKWLYQACKHPLNLSDICRIKIRHTCRNGALHSYVSNLPLPSSLKRFLMLEDVG